MNVCFFTENYYKGGLDTFLINLINAWPDSGDNLSLVCNLTHPGLQTIREKVNRSLDIHGYSLPFTSALSKGQSSAWMAKFYLVRIFYVLAPRFFLYQILFPWYVLTLTFFFYRSDYDRLMVVNGGYPASLICRSALIAWRLAGKRPLAVMNFHNSASRAPWYCRFIENFIDAQVIKSASYIVSVSKDCLQSLRNRSAFAGCSKLSFIYNGIEDPVCFSKTFSIPIKNKSSVKKYCLMLATYEARKGHYYLLNAFKRVLRNFPDLQLLIYGHGRLSEKKHVAEEIARLNLENNVTLGDFVPVTTSLLSGASVLLVPSQSHESFGLTIIEAMAFGLPVVTTDVGGMPEVLGKSDAGYVCSKDDPEEFSEAIIKIVGNQLLASELGENGRKAYERRFMATTMATQYALIIKAN